MQNQLTRELDWKSLFKMLKQEMPFLLSEQAKNLNINYSIHSQFEVE